MIESLRYIMKYFRQGKNFLFINRSMIVICKLIILPSFYIYLDYSNEINKHDIEYINISCYILSIMTFMKNHQ